MHSFSKVCTLAPCERGLATLATGTKARWFGVWGSEKMRESEDTVLVRFALL